MSRPEQLAFHNVRPTTISVDAEFSPDNVHRYRLVCRWGPGPVLPWVMCNPSLAGSEAYADNLDPTLRRVRGFTQAAGLHAFAVVNVYSVVDPDPSVLSAYAADSPTEAEQAAMRWAADLANADGCPGLVCAWGAHRDAVARAAVVMPHLRRARTLLCLRTTSAGHPGHPLYLPKRLQLAPWAP